MPDTGARQTKDAGKLVFYDDCRLTSGMMVDAKGPGYHGLLAASNSALVPEWSSVVQEWWQESGRQVAAGDRRLVRWHFAELPVALFARKMTTRMEVGREFRLYFCLGPKEDGNGRGSF